MAYDLIVRKKSGFASDSNTPIIIRDDRGFPFYDSRSLGPVESFNLPAGKYFVDSGNFTKMATPVYFKKDKLPFPEIAFATLPLNFKIVFDTNPNKCTIYWTQKLIVFDDGSGSGVDFRNVPRPYFDFILNHEYGHTFYGYGTLYEPEAYESYCDRFASNRMLDMGYNPSQIKEAPKATLSSRQDYRKEIIEQTLLNNA